MGSLREAFRLGVRHLREFPQLLYTAFVAVVIVGVFAYTVWSFGLLAQEAHERTAEVRVGSLLDGIALAAQLGASDPKKLEDELVRIAMQNETLLALEVWAKPKNATSSDFQRIVALAREGFSQSVWDRAVSIVGFTLGDPNGQTYLRLDEAGEERMYLAARAFPNDEGYVRAAFSLSQADVAISERLWRAYALTLALVLVVLLLVFRVARVTDYALLYQRLREAEALKDRFFSLASHELRAPITAVRGYLSLLSEELRSENERALARKAQEASEMLAQLVNDLLDVSRIAEGRLQFTLTCLRAAEVCESVVNAFRPLAQEKGLKLSLTCPSDVWVRADQTRLAQVLNNLVSNAIKYTPKGSVELRVRQEDGEPFVEFVVEDTGLGMSAQEQQHLFERFYRSEREEVRAQTGTGLGMWITRELVERMGGTISVESIEGRGTKVRVRLPACRPSSRGEA